MDFSLSTGPRVHGHPLVTMALREIITWISAEHHLAGWKGGGEVRWGGWDVCFFFSWGQVMVRHPSTNLREVTKENPLKFFGDAMFSTVNLNNVSGLFFWTWMLWTHLCWANILHLRSEIGGHYQQTTLDAAQRWGFIGPVRRKYMW